MTRKTSVSGEAIALVAAVTGVALAATGIGLAGLTATQAGSGLAGTGFVLAAVGTVLDRRWERALGWALAGIGALLVGTGSDGAGPLVGALVLLVGGVVLLWTTGRRDEDGFDSVRT